MKSLSLIIVAGLLLTACIQPGKYTGTKYPKTKTVEVYHSASEIKRKYHVIGELVNANMADKDKAKVMTADAKRVGGDGVIIAVDSMATGKSKPKHTVAQVIKYD